MVSSVPLTFVFSLFGLHQFSSVQSLSCVQLFATPWIAAHQASLSITNSRSSHSNSCPSSQWCHPAISSSVIPFSSCPQSLPASESFPMSQLFTWGGPSTGVSALASFLPKNSQSWSPLEWTGCISKSPRDSQESSPTPQFKNINSLVLSFLHSPTLTSIHDHYMLDYIWSHYSNSANLNLPCHLWWTQSYMGKSAFSLNSLPVGGLGIIIPNSQVKKLRFQGKITDWCY